MEEFFTWAMLGTFAGATAAVALITQFVKEPLNEFPTQAVSYVIALLMLVLSTLATGTAEGWADWAIIPLNAVAVSLAANGGYAAAKRAIGT